MGCSTDIRSPRTFSPTEPVAATAPFYLAALPICIALCIALGCQSQQPLRAPETFDDVYEKRELLHDSVMILTGRFMGWRGTDCMFPSYAARQATRSDWISMMGGACLYVTGGTPPGLSAMEESSTEQDIVLEARARYTPDGKLLLEYVRATPKSQ